MNKQLCIIHNDFKNIPALYSIIYLPTGQKYVGSTFKLRSRINTHVRDLNLKRHHNKNLQNLFDNDSDFNNFKFECIKEFEIVQNRKEILPLLEKEEQYLIDSGDYELNILRDASVNRKVDYTYEELYGEEKAIEMKNKVIESNKTRIVTEETKRKISKSLKGRKYSEERSYKCGNAFRGKKRPEHSIKMKEICKLRKQKQILNGELS